jgi:tetratricopeptide (TPR) repeat protein
MDITGFGQVAQYLTHPLVLVGFVLMLAYGIHWQLMKSGLLSKVDKKDSGIIIRLFLRYGFWLALTLLLAGVGLSAWNSWMEKEKVVSVDAGKLAREMVGPLQGQLEAKDQQIKALTEAITALSKTGASAASINAALQELEQGHTAQAQAIFAEVLRSKEAEGKQANKEAAAAARHLGALAYMNDTKAALAAYRKAVELDPDNADGWNQLATLFLRTGELAKAEEAYHKVLALGEAHQDKKEQAWAVGNIGNMYLIHGDLDKAEEMYRKALALHEALGSKEDMAIQYGNIGIMYYARGDLKKTEEMLRKSLALHEALSSKRSMAGDYINLGVMYQTHGELDKAEEMHKKALALHEVLDSKDGMAGAYGNLGIVYANRGELDKAEEMHKKALALDEALGNKGAMATNYANLGRVYAQRGNFTQAEAYWKKSLSLFQEMKHPAAKQVQQWLDELAQKKNGSSR